MKKQQLRYIRTTLWCTSNLVIHYYSSGSLHLTHSQYVKRMLEFLSRHHMPARKTFLLQFFLQLLYYNNKTKNRQHQALPKCQFCNSKQTPKYVIFWPSIMRWSNKQTNIKRSSRLKKKTHFMKQHTIKQLLFFSFFSFLFYSSSSKCRIRYHEPPLISKEKKKLTPLKLA